MHVIPISFLRNLLTASLLGLFLPLIWGQTLRPAQGQGAAGAGLNVPTELLSAPDRSADFIVALVDNEPITNHDVRMMAQRLRDQIRQSGRPATSEDDFKNEALELLIYERSQLQWAKEQNIRIAEDELKSMAESMANRNKLTLDEFYQALERQGVSKKRFLENMREQQILQRVRDRDVPTRIKITEPEIDRVISQQKAALSQNAMVELAQILIALPEGANSDQVNQAEQKANQLRKEIEGGADFQELTRTYSDAPDRNLGGSLGMRPSDRYPELFIQATQNIPEGGIAGPIRSGAGFHLLKVLQRKDASRLTMPQTHARHILLKPAGNLSPGAARSRLNDLRQQIEQGKASFEEVARQYSQDGSAGQGGDLDWASPGFFVPEFEQVLNELKINEISEPVVSRFGVHLIQVLERREVPMSSSQEREYARNVLRENKYDEALDTWAREVRGKAYVEYREPPQ
jgi:peptidyl-prolyl cis-trans isomerase SurA